MTKSTRGSPGLEASRSFLGLAWSFRSVIPAPSPVWQPSTRLTPTGTIPFNDSRPFLKNLGNFERAREMTSDVPASSLACAARFVRTCLVGLFRPISGEFQPARASARHTSGRLVSGRSLSWERPESTDVSSHDRAYRIGPTEAFSTRRCPGDAPDVSKEPVQGSTEARSIADSLERPDFARLIAHGSEPSWNLQYQGSRSCPVC